MKKTALILLCIVAFSGFCHAKVTRLGLVNPTPPNLEKVLFLLNHHYIDLHSVEIVGIYHSTQYGLIESTNKFIEKHGYTNISIVTIKNTIPLDNLFATNRYTEEFKAIFRKTDGLVFLGGADISPEIYGEKTFLTTELIPSERNWELSFLFHLIGGSQNTDYVPLLEENPDYLILGICLGMQQMNVASGGSLVQDIPFQLYKKKDYESVLAQDVEKQHKNYRPRVNSLQDKSAVLHFHRLNIVPNSLLDFEGIQHPRVTSVHHQSVKKPGKDFRIIATSLDKKVVEAIAHTRYRNVYGIQFHPEFAMLYQQEEFLDARNEPIVFDRNDSSFHRHFWQDFSKRLQNKVPPGTRPKSNKP